MKGTPARNLRLDISIRQDTSGDKFIIDLDEQETNHRGIAGELILRRAREAQKPNSTTICGDARFLALGFTQPAGAACE